MSQMVEVKTTELSGPALDWAVAQAEELQDVGIILPPVVDERNQPAVLLNKERWIYGVEPARVYSPSSDWSQGGTLLDRHCKSFGCVQDGRDGTWRAFGYGKGKAFDPNRTMNLASGPSILIAACRAIVKAKLGDTVTVPAELLP